MLGLTYATPDGTDYDAPADYYQFYKEQTAAATFGVVGVPAAAFASNVTGTPDEAALRELFRLGKSEDPDPEKPRIGLREPRKLKVEAVELTGDEPYFASAAAEVAANLGVMAKLQGFLVAPLGGVTAAGLLTAVPPATAADPQLDKAYADYVKAHQSALGGDWFTPFGQRAVPDPYFARPARPPPRR